MDSSKNVGDTEDCGSNESGWTMYLASPIHGNKPDDDDDDDDDDEESGSEGKEYKGFHDDDGGDGESDDSMASDASSGPSHQGGPCGTSEGSHGRDEFEHAVGKDNARSSGKKQSNQVEKIQRAEKTKAEEEEQEHKAKSSTGDVYSKGKSRKNK